MTLLDEKAGSTNRLELIGNEEITQQHSESVKTMAKAKAQTILYKTLAQEIKETLQAKKDNPQDPRNYIHAGKLYSCQGKQQKAATILREGLRVISDSQHYPMIQQEMDIVKIRLKRKIDFIAKCPFEIIHHIVNQFNLRQNTALECLTVSPIWHQKLMNQVHLWRHIEISAGSWGQNLHQGLSDVSSLVEDLSIGLSKGATRRLPNGSQMLGETIRTYLPYVGNTLKKLILNASSSTDISLEWLLVMCPKLTYLCLEVDKFADNPQGIKVPETMSLTTIELSCKNPAPVSMLMPLFHCSPHLRYLGLQCFIDIDVLSLLDDLCPELAEIRLYEKYRYSHERILWSNGYQREIAEAVEPKGALRCLEIEYIQSAIPLKFRLKKSCDTLQAISLKMNCMNGHEISDWQPFSSFTMNKLTCLNICNGCPTFYQHLSEILPCFPALEIIRLQTAYGPGYSMQQLNEITRDNVFEAIGKITTLTTLSLDSFSLQSDGFEKMLIMMEQTSHGKNDNEGLECLKINYCHGFKGSALRHIATIKSLKKLFIWDWDVQRIEVKDVIDFVRLSKDGLPLLQTLFLDNIQMTVEAAEGMMEWNMENLKTLRLGRRMEYFKNKNVIKKMLNCHFDNVMVEI
ncbi:hypothetical protein INT45_012837 [Circinella minor]|uniref:F-box domain-containing protein n=1 Tax=Circinella minor TaxID=1195481 RepID=A0A8H7S6S3_9FUNG|nr:hypothetical protein INT45_012837 [Circinella minor]